MAASSAAFKELKDHSVVVFLHSREDKSYEQISPKVITGLQAAKMGNTIPKVVIMDADSRTTFASLNHDELGNSKTYRSVKSEVKDYLKGEKTPPASEEKALHWNAKGKRTYWTGEFDKMTDTHLVLKNNGKEMKLPLDNLSEGAVAYAKALSGAPADAEEKAEPKAELDFEAWISSDGRKIEAKFVSLDSDKVNLVTKAGKSYAIPLVRLSDESQSRAKELGAP